MDKKFEPLFTPWKIGNLEIKNRIVLTSMGGTSIFGWMEPAHFDKEAAKFLLDKAKNNVGLVLPGIAPIKNPFMGGWLYSNKKMYKDLKDFMVEFHKTGAKMFIQLTAGFGRSMAVNSLMIKASKIKPLGFVLKPFLNVDYLCASPSRLPNRWYEDLTCRELKEEEIEEQIEAFARISKLCQESGVDGIEVHAVHEGYLLDQFTLKYCNHRNDKWGGSFENRYRFPIEIVKRIKERCGKDFPVSLRYSVISKTKDFGKGAMPNETYKEIGRDLQESEEAAKLFENAGYDMLNCDNGTYDAWYWAHPPAYMPKNCNLDDVAKIKKCVNIPVVCAGRMTPSVGSEAIKKGKIDAIGIARQFLVDPTWINKLIEDRLDDIRPCICCHNGCFNMCHYKGVGNDQDLSDTMHMARCALNPTTMQSNKYLIKPAKHIKNVAIIGGGIGGMETALVLAKRGHNVTIFEKSDVLGGVFIAASKPSFKENDRLLIDYYRKEIAKNCNKIRVNFNFEVKCPDCLKKQGSFDEIVVATGAKPRQFTIPGFNKGIDASEYLLGLKEVGDNPIIIGGGLTGSEIAYDLCLKGKFPIIVEQKNDLIAQKGVCLANSSYLRDYFALHQVHIFLSTTLKEIINEGVLVINDKGKPEIIKGSSVILSVGYNSNPVIKKGRHIHLVGDAYQVGNLKTVIFRAWDVGMKI